jgi:hypothetical protein
LGAWHTTLKADLALVVTHDEGTVSLNVAGIYIPETEYIIAVFSVMYYINRGYEP